MNEPAASKEPGRPNAFDTSPEAEARQLYKIRELLILSILLGCERIGLSREDVEGGPMTSMKKLRDEFDRRGHELERWEAACGKDALPHAAAIIEERDALRADKEIRQTALNGVLGRPASADYYSAVEDVAELRRALKLAEERVAKTRQALQIGDEWSVQHGALALRSERDRLRGALEKLQTLVVGACSCAPTLVAIHEPGSSCGDPQYEAIHELLDAELSSANLAGADDRAYGAASRAGDLVLKLLDILRGRKEPKLETPITEVRLDGLIPDENLGRLRAILRGDEDGPASLEQLSGATCGKTGQNTPEGCDGTCSNCTDEIAPHEFVREPACSECEANCHDCGKPEDHAAHRIVEADRG